jgi:MFS family permease
MKGKVAASRGGAPARSPAGKITAILFVAQCLGSAGFIAMSTVGAILAAELSGRSWAGVPAAASSIAGAGAAFLWGYLMDSLGRRRSLALGIFCGALGALASIFAIVHGSFFLLVAGMVFVGIAQAAVTLSRFVAAEVNTPERRGRAISYVVLGGTVGAILGPLLVAPSGRMMAGAGVNELAGAFAAAAILLVAAGAIVLVALRPDPREIGRALADSLPRPGTERSARRIGIILRQPVAAAAVVSMVLGQAVMVAVMVITSLYMKDMHHDLADVSIVFSAHTIGMYAFSLLSGRLADRWGRAPVIITGALVLIVACLTASLTAATFPIAGSLLLLGLGWNFCFVGGSALLSDQLEPAERARTQGFNDLLLGLAAGIGSFGSGLVSSAIGYGGVGITGAVLSLIPLVLVARRFRAIRRVGINPG